jgi:transposase
VARNAWFGRFAGIRLNQLVFIDEFGATTNMTRLYARGPRGQRVVYKTPHGHWKILTTIAAMDVRGIRTACCFDGATDTEMFVAFIRTFLVPTLKPGQIVVMDNLSAHKSPRVDELVEAAGGRVMRLPPYSFDFNPIENAISKMKSALRKLGRRSIEELEAGVAEAMRSITSSDARAFMKHCGYAATSA